jgi:cobalt-zinc-cadmium efflux system membrane fusion protein
MIVTSYPYRAPRIIVIHCLPLLLFLNCCSRAPETSPESKPAMVSPIEDQRISIDPVMIRQTQLKLETVRQALLPEIVQVMGRIGVNENRTARVGAIADGRITTVQANVGDAVQEGQKLASMRSHEVDVARADYAKAQAEHKRRQAELDFARNSLIRSEKLYQLKAASIEQVQRAKADQENAQAQVTSAQADIGRIEEQLSHLGLSPESAQREYGDGMKKKPGEFEEDELIPVTAPLSGTILKRLVSPGTVVTPSNDLFILSDLSTLWLTADVPEKYLAMLKPGLTARFTVQAYPNETFSARIIQIEDSLDRDTRTIQVRCLISNSAQKLKPEMYSTIFFELGDGNLTTVIPASAVQDVEGKATVFRQSDDRHFQPVRVRLGRQASARMEILEGLKPGDIIATEGSFLLKSELLKQSMSQE